MIRGCIGVKNKWPENLSKTEILEARVYSIFGYDSRINKFWKQLKLRFPFEGRKIFVFGESIPWMVRNKNESLAAQGGMFTAIKDPWTVR
jgi:hypothetical protein